jgi:hypothetical protein
MGNEQRRHSRLGHAQPDPVAGDARLGDLEQRRADPVAVADADLVVGEPVDGQILAELAEVEGFAPKHFLPVMVRSDLIDEDRAMLAAMRGEIALCVAVDVQAAHPAPPGDRALPDGGADGPVAPSHVARQADIDREQSSQRITHGSACSRESARNETTAYFASRPLQRSTACAPTAWGGACGRALFSTPGRSFNHRRSGCDAAPHPADARRSRARKGSDWS